LIGLPVLILIISAIKRLSSVKRNALVLKATDPSALLVLLRSPAALRDEDEATSSVVYTTITEQKTIPILLIFY
tara:strand:- start:287 stop:508 length:222 start_codon:yes stop_codon:yes gene_type:complete